MYGKHRYTRLDRKQKDGPIPVVPATSPLPPITADQDVPTFICHHCKKLLTIDQKHFTINALESKASSDIEVGYYKYCENCFNSISKFL